MPDPTNKPSAEALDALEAAHCFIEEWYKAKGWPSENEWHHVCAVFATTRHAALAHRILTLETELAEAKSEIAGLNTELEGTKIGLGDARRAIVETKTALAARGQLETTQTIDIVFDGPPGPESGRFIEVESPPGSGLSFGEWVQRDDGYWALRFEHVAPIRLAECRAALAAREGEVERLGAGQRHAANEIANAIRAGITKPSSEP